MSNTHNGIFLSNADGTLKEYGNNAGSGGSEDIQWITKEQWDAMTPEQKSDPNVTYGVRGLGNNVLHGFTQLYDSHGFLEACDISYIAADDNYYFTDQAKGVDIPAGDYLVSIMVKTTGNYVRLGATRNGSNYRQTPYFFKGGSTYLTYVFVFNDIDYISWDYSSGGTSYIHDLRIWKIN